MAIRLRGGSYQVDVGKGSSRVRESWPIMAQAEERELVLKLALKRGERPLRKAQERASEATRGVGPMRDASTLEGLLELSSVIRWKHAKSAGKLKANAQACIDVLGRSQTVNSLTQAAVDGLVLELQRRGNSGATINRKLAALSVLLKTAKRHGLLAELPELQRQREADHRMRWLTREEEAAARRGAPSMGGPPWPTSWCSPSTPEVGARRS